jgi:hypothetical protein
MTAMPNPPVAPQAGAPHEQERGLGEITGDLWDNAETLLRQEIQLGIVELERRANVLKDELKIAAVGAGMLYVGLLAFVAMLILGLSQWMESWLAALIVSVCSSVLGYALSRREPARMAATITTGVPSPKEYDRNHTSQGGVKEAVK